ncbi:MAG: nucleotidyl transferase AbiEii/AbiGii toxin family protein [Thermodesulfobacteriota bacterium]
MFKELLSKIGACLKKYDLPYMIIGGQAVLLYGEPRLTRDIDVTLGAGIENLSKVVSITKELSLKPIPENIESFVKETMVLPAINEDTGIRVDFIFSFTPYEAEAIKRARKIDILGTEVFFAAPEDLIIHKIFAGRARDVEDLKSVLIKNPAIDVKYIESWLKKFDESESASSLLETFDGILKEIRQSD